MVLRLWLATSRRRHSILENRKYETCRPSFGQLQWLLPPFYHVQASFKVSVKHKSRRRVALTSPLGQCSGPLFIRTPAEAQELAVNCSVFDGNLYLSGGRGAFNLSGMTHIHGSLSSTGPDDMTQVTANDLRSIDGRLSIGNS